MSRKGKIKRTAKQDIDYKPLYIYNDSIKTIKSEQTIYKVFVFKKFYIEKNKKFNIKIWEADGDRNMEFYFTTKDFIKIKKLK